MSSIKSRDKGINKGKKRSERKKKVINQKPHLCVQLRDIQYRNSAPNIHRTNGPGKIEKLKNAIINNQRRDDRSSTELGS